MNSSKILSEIFNSAKQIPIDNSTKIVLMSDCHRGDGSWADAFSKNKNTFYAALNQYYKSGFTYIELGDGDELWATKHMSNIVGAYKDIFRLMSKFYREGRFYSLFGNHDMPKKFEKYVERNFSYYFHPRLKKQIPLFPGIKFYDGIILYNEESGDKIFLVHGHQGDFKNHRVWRMSSFLFRYFWKPLALFGVNDPTRTAKNYIEKEKVDRSLRYWIAEKSQMLIAGHTHRPMFPEPDDLHYFNIGSCVHPRCITAMEIEDGKITLVKWSIKTKDDGTLYIARGIIAGPRKLSKYFSN